MVEDRSTDEIIRLEVELSVPPDTAWQLLTEKGHLAVWWGDHVTLEARHLGAFVEKWSDGGRQIVTSGRITRFEPPFRLDLTWSDHDWPGETEVSMRLSRLGYGAQFELDHYGWDVHPEARRRELMAAHAAGWRAHLSRLDGQSSRSGTRSMMSIMGFAARPGTAVLPTCTALKSVPAGTAFRMTATSSANIFGQDGS